MKTAHCLPIIFLFVVTTALLAGANLARFHDGGADADLGAVSQILWNTVHGAPLYSSYPGLHASIFSEHFNPVYLPLSLLYLRREDPRLLLVVQALVLGLALFPLWRLATLYLGHSAALLVALAYAVNPAVHYIAWFDFHPVTLMLPVYLTAFMFHRRRQWRALALTLGFSLLIDESASVILVAWGLFFALHGPRRFALTAIAAGALTYALLIFCFLPAFARDGGTPYYFFLQYFQYLPGETGWEKLSTALQHPAPAVAYLLDARSAGYLGLLLLGFAFLPLLVPAYLVIALPQFAFNLLSGFPETASIHLHYNSSVLAVLAAATVSALAKLKNRLRFRGRPLTIPLAACVLAGSLAGHAVDSPLPFLATRQFHPDGFGDPARFALAQPLLHAIPAAASVGTEYKYWAYLSLRRGLFLFFDPQHPPADYYLLDTRTNVIPPYVALTDRGFIDRLQEQGYLVAGEADGIVLLRRGSGEVLR